MGRKKKIIEPIKQTSFESLFNFCIGKSDKHKNKEVKKDINKMVGIKSIENKQVDNFFSYILREKQSKDRVYNDDCLEVLSNLKNDSVDLIATDPPYEINFEKNTWDKPNQLNWDVLASEFKRICKPNANIIIFQGWSNVCNTKNTLDKYFDIKDWIIYDRIKGRGGKKSLVSTREDILWYVCNPNDYTYNKISSTIKKKTGGTIGRRNGNEFRALSNVWTDISPIVPWSKERVKHPTQKPLQIMNRIITLFSNENDVVLDPFMGSGSTCLACFSLNRRYIGIEKDIEYFNVFQNRIKETANV